MTDSTPDVVRRSERRLQAIIDAEPACLKIVSAGGILLDMNRAGLEMLGAADLSQVVGRQAFDLVHPVLMSGYDESRSHGTSAGEPIPLLRKPFTATVLAQAVRNRLDTQRQA